MTDKKDNISLDTFKLIARAGVIMGQANPKKDVDTLVKAVVEETIRQLLGE